MLRRAIVGRAAATAKGPIIRAMMGNHRAGGSDLEDGGGGGGGRSSGVRGSGGIAGSGAGGVRRGHGPKDATRQQRGRRSNGSVVVENRPEAGRNGTVNGEKGGERRAEPNVASQKARLRVRQKRGPSNAGKAKAAATGPSIETADFRSRFHAMMCRAARYKVHAPLCDCPKVDKLRKRHRDAGAQRSTNDGGEEALPAGGASSAFNVAYSSEVQFDVDGTIVSDQLSKLNITRDNDYEIGEDPFNNLIVVPDTKSPQAIYACEGTDRRAFLKDGMTCEGRIAREIFRNDSSQEKAAATEGKGGTDAIPPFKVNCAICLLKTHQRNGFVAIASHSREELLPTIQRAREAASLKLGNGGRAGLHADHAHFVCAINISSLQSLLSAGKTRGKDRQVNAEIVSQMEEGGVDLLLGSSVEIKMGHHLTSFLWLLGDRQIMPGDQNSGNKNNRDSCNDNWNRHLQYIMAMGYDDGRKGVELDLPGGKRHLGESTLGGAVREVEEECSLRIDRKWFAGRVSVRYGGALFAAEGGDDDVQVLEPQRAQGSESGDAFFVMGPPPPPPPPPS